LNTSKVKPIWSSQTQKAFTKISHSKRGKAKEALNHDLLGKQGLSTRFLLAQQTPRERKLQWLLKKKLSWHIRGKLDNLEILGS